MISRRGFIAGALAAPLVVKSGVLMPVRPIILTPPGKIQFTGLMPYQEAAYIMATLEFETAQFARGLRGIQASLVDLREALPPHMTGTSSKL